MLQLNFRDGRLERCIVAEAFAEPHHFIISPEHLETKQVEVLSALIKETIKREVIADIARDSSLLGFDAMQWWGRRDLNSSL